MKRTRLNKYLQSIAVTAVAAQDKRSVAEVLGLLDDILTGVKEAVAIAELIEEGQF